MSNKIPITIGVIGNRDAKITREQEEQIIQLFEDIDSKYPNNPVSLFSQLAIGADTAVASIFIDIKENTNRDYALIVPIPYELEKYKKEQFKTNLDLEVFNNLLAKSEKYFVLENNDALQTNNYLYRQGGKFVADSSIILIALWDETINEKDIKIGGTADTVGYKINGTFYNEVDNQIFDLEGSLISIYCERKAQKNGSDFVFKNKYTNLAGILKDKSINKTLNKIIEFNKTVKQEIKETNSIERLKQIRKIISSETSVQQKKYNKTIMLFFLLGFIFFTLFEIYKHKGLLTVVFGFIIGILIIGFRELFKSHKSRSHHNYIENRVLSEALRVQFFWNLSNLNKNASNYIIRIHKLEYNWIKHFLKSVYGLTYDVTKIKHEKIEDVKNDWIIFQKDWFKDKEDEINKKEVRLKNTSLFMLVLGIFGLIGIALFKYFNPEIFIVEPHEFPLTEHYKHIKHLEHLCHLFIIIDSIIFGISAILKAYIDKKGYGQIKNQYRMSKDVFETANIKMNIVLNDINIDKKTKEKELDRLLYFAGKEALIETGNWYLIMKEKDPEFEIGV